MTWHFQIAHRVESHGDVYDIREVYESLGKDGSVSWTEDSIAPIGNTRDELLEELRMMLADAEKYPVLEVGG